jgi:hypothetical protein
MISEHGYLKARQNVEKLESQKILKCQCSLWRKIFCTPPFISAGTGAQTWPKNKKTGSGPVEIGLGIPHELHGPRGGPSLLSGATSSGGGGGVVTGQIVFVTPNLKVLSGYSNLGAWLGSFDPVSF